MQSQKELLNKYLSLSSKTTLKHLSHETGIQFTRMFRILNGSPMKFSESETIQKLILKKMGIDSNLENLALECQSKLSAKSLREIEELMKRKLIVWDLKNTVKTEHQQSISA